MRPTSSAPAVSTSSDSSSRLASVSSAVSGGRVTPTRTIFSRMWRSIRDMGETTSSGEGGVQDSDRGGVAGEQHGVAESDLHRTARHVHAGPVASELPIMGRGGRRARTSSAGGGGADAALVDHHLDLAWLAGGDDLDVRATGGGGVDPGADLDELVEAGERLAAPVQHHVGVADVDVNSAEDVSLATIGRASCGKRGCTYV